jgi:hypothetical protein
VRARARVRVHVRGCGLVAALARLGLELAELDEVLLQVRRERAPVGVREPMKSARIL